MKNTARTLASTALLTFASFAFPASAGGDAAPPATAPSTAAAESHAKKHEDFVEKRIKELHAKLNITDAQSQKWDAFAETMRDNAQKTDNAFHERADKMATQNADDSMKSYAALAQLHADNMQKLAAAFSDLYATLSDDQKKIADKLFRHEGEHHGHGHGHKPAAAAPAPAAPAPAK
ncbi:MAG: Spy/CpxP family protein refolding chaperone [Nevskia sp.]|nr:Spy/CpxP family protein refolding chaperone [Nevskia sp.]